MNYKKLPKHDEVEQIGDFKLVTLTDENRAHVAEIAFSMYTNEPCRICGELLTAKNRDMVYAGYSEGDKSRAAHKACWDSNTPKHLWAYPIDSK